MSTSDRGFVIDADRFWSRVERTGGGMHVGRGPVARGGEVTESPTLGMRRSERIGWRGNYPAA